MEQTHNVGDMVVAVNDFDDYEEGYRKPYSIGMIVAVKVLGDNSCEYSIDWADETTVYNNYGDGQIEKFKSYLNRIQLGQLDPNEYPSEEED